MTPAPPGSFFISRKRMRVLYVTPECAPLVKAGGLGDVSATTGGAARARARGRRAASRVCGGAGKVAWCGRARPRPRTPPLFGCCGTSGSCSRSARRSTSARARFYQDAAERTGRTTRCASASFRKLRAGSPRATTSFTATTAHRACPGLRAAKRRSSRSTISPSRAISTRVARPARAAGGASSRCAARVSRPDLVPQGGLVHAARSTR